MIKQKKCKKCGILKSVDEFYKHKDYKRHLDGIRSQCKLCTIKQVKKYYWANRDKCLRESKERDRKRPDLMCARVKRYRNKYPERQRARKTLREKIRRGELQRGCCNICSQPNAEGHHSDYNKPDEVVWLCKLHHMRLHHEAITN